MSKWVPERDACNECQECNYFLHDYWNCQGELEPCHEFIPRPGSNKKLVSLEVNIKGEQ